MWQIDEEAPWLVVRFPQPMNTLGWTLQGGGRTRSAVILWREVRNEDLPEDLDPHLWLARQTAAMGAPKAPCFLTSARISDYADCTVKVGPHQARVLVTAGLGNAERIGQRRKDLRPIGTINALLALDEALSEGAALEALSLLAEARTAAMLDHAPRLWPAPATGTGTDCLCLCYPDGPPAFYAGKHTELGEAVGQAAYSAFSTAIRRWKPPA